MNFFTSFVSQKAKLYVAEVLDSGMLSEGEWVRRFEEAIEKFYYPRDTRVVATNSGTSALHLALKTLGIGAGDEVIVPPLTFIATGLAVLYCGATPVFADIDNTGAIDPFCIGKNITPKTKAIIAVNWAGSECNIHALESFAKLYNVKLIVDAAQSFGSHLYGDAVCFSFQATKHLTTGDGGAVVFMNEVDYNKGRRLSWFGIDRKADVAGVLGEREYNLRDFGFKYQMNNVAAAIGLSNIESARDILMGTKRTSDSYCRGLSAKHIVSLKPYAWAYPVQAENVVGFSKYLKDNGVPCTNLHRGIDNNDIFGVQDLPMMRWWEKHVTHLPVHHEITEDNIAWICEKVNEYV